MMSRVFISILASVTTLMPLYGQEQNSILWEVRGNNIPGPCYLLGTLKFIEEDKYTVPKKALELLKTCSLFAMESPVDHHAQHELNKAVHLPSGSSLATELSSQEYAKTKLFFKNEFGIKEKKFKKKHTQLTPLALSITLMRLSLHERIRFYDRELLQIAKSNKMETYSLETIDRAAQALLVFPMSRQIKILMSSIDHFNKRKENFAMMQSAYIHGDLDKASEYSFHLLENDSTFMEEFYFKRNEEWLPKLEKMFSSQKSFIAVGLLHLKKERGLLAMLKSKGYILTPISIQ